MTETEKQDRREVKIGVVFATYRDTVPAIGGGQPRLVTRTARRGETVSIPSAEADRLESLGALSTASAQDVIDRALNPNDASAEGATGGEPVTVSPPALGAEPSGDITKGDTGGDDVQPVTVTPDSGGAATFDARAADVDQAAEWLRSERPKASDVVDAAHDDPEAAQTLLEAERIASNGDPRKTVEQPLQAIIDSGDDSGDDS